MNKKESYRFYPQRSAWAHKGEYGRVFIVAGSAVHSGSPIFNAMAALRSGADLVTVAGPRRAMDIAAAFTPDIITYPLDGELDLRHVSAIATHAKYFDSLIIGGGLARRPETYTSIQKLIQKINLPTVIDAEAIRAFGGKGNIARASQAVLTPHAEEFRVLTGETVKPDVRDRKEKVKKWAKKLRTVILLKGYADIISDGDTVLVNKTGSPLMTKGGFGDTLSGICGTFLARGVEPLRAAQYAAYINGRAGRLACRKYGEGVLASDTFEFISSVCKG